jgi:hypothetical protein
MKSYWGVEVLLHAFLSLGTSWKRVVSFTLRSLYPQEKNLWYPLNRRLRGPQSRYGRGGEEKRHEYSGKLTGERERETAFCTCAWHTTYSSKNIGVITCIARLRSA